MGNENVVKCVKIFLGIWILFFIVWIGTRSMATSLIIPIIILFVWVILELENQSKEENGRR